MAISSFLVYQATAFKVIFIIFARILQISNYNILFDTKRHGQKKHYRIYPDRYCINWLFQP